MIGCNVLSKDFQFNLETALTMSQLTGKSTDEGNATTLWLIPKGTEGKTAAQVSAMSAAE